MHPQPTRRQALGGLAAFLAAGAAPAPAYPLADLEAQRILDRHKAAGKMIDLDFHERTVRRVADALRAGLKKAGPVTHLGLGQARVEKVSSNRRYLGPDGQPHFDRSSASGG